MERYSRDGFSIISQQWLSSISTNSGGWSLETLRLLGVSWPPRKGWARALRGKRITNERRIAIERVALNHRLSQLKHGPQK